MSFFRQQKTALNDQAIVMKSLQDLGYKPVAHNEKVKVRGHGSETRKAEIILSKEDLGEGGDVGLSKDSDGNFEVITDTYVMRKFKIPDFTAALTVKYGENKARAIAKKNGWTPIGTKQVNGKTTLQFVVN